MLGKAGPSVYNELGFVLTTRVDISVIVDMSYWELAKADSESCNSLIAQVFKAASMNTTFDYRPDDGGNKHLRNETIRCNISVDSHLYIKAYFPKSAGITK